MLFCNLFEGLSLDDRAFQTGNGAIALGVQGFLYVTFRRLKACVGLHELEGVIDTPRTQAQRRSFFRPHPNASVRPPKEEKTFREKRGLP